MKNTVLPLVFGREGPKSRVKILGIAGSTCTGKSTLARELQEKLQESGIITKLIGQDDFYKPKEEVMTLRNREEPEVIFYDYDQPTALDDVEMLKEIRRLSSESIDVIIVEGNMVTDLSIFDEIEYTIFFTIDKEVCRSRRVLRAYDPPDERGYFDQIVWPAYERTLARVKAFKPHERSIAFRDANTTILLDEIVTEFHHMICDRVELLNTPLDSKKAIDWVNSPSCGATSVFIGTTRNIFDNKNVKRLEYEAYEEMAYREMARLCKEAHQKNPTMLRIALSHRLGVVPVGEASVIIASSAQQRKAAIEVTEWLINSLKERVPIWKKELYTDGTYSWKENREQSGCKL